MFFFFMLSVLSLTKIVLNGPNHENSFYLGIIPDLQESIYGNFRKKKNLSWHTRFQSLSNLISGLRPKVISQVST